MMNQEPMYGFSTDSLTKVWGKSSKLDVNY